MSKMFESTKINGMILKNRFVRSATYEGMADECGGITGRLTEYYTELAKGGVGLIITGHAYVCPEGQAGPWQMGVHNDSLIPGLIGMVKAVHAAGRPIVLQLAHAGPLAATQLSGLDAYGPSVFELEGGIKSREMTGENIRSLVFSYVDAAVRAQKSGFDGIQIHLAHGYLLSQFISPFFNRRKDIYGGNIQNRVRIVLEIIQAIREEVGDQYPILVKLNSEDFVNGGMTVDEMLVVAGLLEDAGIDVVEMSGGTLTHSGVNNPMREGKLSPDKECYYRDAARRYKKVIKTPLILVGGIRSFDLAEKLVLENSADYISVCRPLIREPALINRWESGERAPSSCLSDNLCIKPVFEGKGVSCPFED